MAIGRDAFYGDSKYIWRFAGIFSMAIQNKRGDLRGYFPWRFKMYMAICGDFTMAIQHSVRRFAARFFFRGGDFNDVSPESPILKKKVYKPNTESID